MHLPQQDVGVSSVVEGCTFLNRMQEYHQLVRDAPSSTGFGNSFSW